MKLNYKNWYEPQIPFDLEDGTQGAHSVLEWSYKEYGDELVYACSFGLEAMVLLHLIAKIKQDARVIFLDTGLHFAETYETIEKIQKRFPELRIELVKPELSLEQQEKKFGAKLWERNPNQCCYYRKVKPLEDQLSKATAWLSGLRREQSETRKHVQFINKDERFQSIKICPLIHWTEEEVWSFVKRNDLPYNPLHDQQYPSIGCAPCTHQIVEGQDSRSGRWRNSNKTECGLHLDPPSEG
ncbi:phosphoadenylyl-sulfate reductase [Bacillus solimangrovi]|uniref:Adenosine 5'-phosphosulfate reductase n=1 Tax=Bacillus solimangrovi TaxID=1305675 RepID=A0A1E5LF85_9BACI|nr:phosphoadenylyl-sulfate reductase [Bacillus solimangrovi]OEH92748.1 phosphoadenosine phosphosulfate reductase [Bacillus solimangrovi]